MSFCSQEFDDEIFAASQIFYQFAKNSHYLAIPSLWPNILVIHIWVFGKINFLISNLVDLSLSWIAGCVVIVHEN